MTRRYLAPAEKQRIIAKQGGLCARGCGTRVGGGETVEWDHILPLGLGGTNMPDNFQGVCTGCHKDKTRTDIRMMRKADRQGKKHRGEKRSRWKWPSRKFWRPAAPSQD